MRGSIPFPSFFCSKVNVTCATGVQSYFQRLFHVRLVRPILTCRVAFKLDPVWKITASSASMIDNRLTY